MEENYSNSDNIVDEESEEFQPYDPEKISIDTKKVTMDTCLRRLEQDTIILAPDFQRNEVWSDEKKGRLIESLMLKIPVPMFYVAADEKGVFSVVDGLQRLSTIRSFILGDDYLKTQNPAFKGHGFRLDGLEFWGNLYNGKNFNELPNNIQNRILETEFTFTIINPGTPEEVKRNIFKRINTGGEPLTPQEIRHALYTGTSTKLLVRLSNSKHFANIVGSSVKSARMLDRELILRFLAFIIRDYTHYQNSMDNFLSDTMRIINLMPSLNGKDAKKLFPNENDRDKVLVKDVEKLELLFNRSMLRALQIFGSHTFRKSHAGGRKAPINKSLFEVWSKLLAELDDDNYEILLIYKDDFLYEYSLLLDNDVSFSYAISRDSWKSSGVKYRYEVLNDLLKKYSQ